MDIRHMSDFSRLLKSIILSHNIATCHGLHIHYLLLSASAPSVPLAAVGIGTGPPGDVGSRAVNTSTPVSVTR